MSARPIGPGVFVPIAGPSGAGKDALLAHARECLRHSPSFVFARRVITRPSHSGSEDHDTLLEHEFQRAEEAGAFALSWRSHGLSYGIPAHADDHIRAGRTVVANVSRAILSEIRIRYAHTLPILVTAAPEIIAARLLARGREDPAGIDKRIARNSAYATEDQGYCIVDNGGELDKAARRFVHLLEMAARRQPISA